MNEARYYIRIPVRFLAPPEEQIGGQESFDNKVETLKAALKNNHLDSWAFAHTDLCVVEVEDTRATTSDNGELSNLRRLEQAATPGPWGCVYDGSSDWSIGPEDDPQVGRVGGVWQYKGVGKPTDAELIVVMRNALPKLIDEIERLRGGARGPRP